MDTLEQRIGTVKFFNEDKGFGFITENNTGKEFFVHVSALQDATLLKNDKVSFDIEETPRGFKAVNVVTI